MKVLSLLPIDVFAHSDICRRLQARGPEYYKDYVSWHHEHGPVIHLAGEVGLVIDPTTKPPKEK